MSDRVRDRVQARVRDGADRKLRLWVALGVPLIRLLAATWRVREDRFRSRSANSWLLGERLHGKVTTTIAAGRVAYET